MAFNYDVVRYLVMQVDSYMFSLTDYNFGTIFVGKQFSIMSVSDLWNDLFQILDTMLLSLWSSFLPISLVFLLAIVLQGRSGKLCIHDSTPLLSCLTRILCSARYYV
jgi:hypothetical protein